MHRSLIGGVDQTDDPLLLQRSKRMGRRRSGRLDGESTTPMWTSQCPGQLPVWPAERKVKAHTTNERS